MTSFRPAPPTPLLTLQHVLDLPFPSDLCAAPVGDLVAWVYNEGGCRNIWYAHAGSTNAGTARPLTDYHGDDGTTIGQIRWNHTGDAVVYVRGTLLADGVPPNPASAPAGMGAPAVWRAGVASGAPRWLGTGHSPEVSPATGEVAWIHEGQVWTADEHGERAATRLFQDRGVCSGLAWSPDGSRLAFVSDRGGHALIGVCDTAGRRVTWLAPGVDRDASPTWSSTGDALAFIRLVDNPAPTYMARPAGSPWSVWTADPATGQGQCVWTAAAGPGSVFTPLATGPQLLWTPSGRLVFPWEGSGWLHLYGLVPGSDAAIDMTPGAFEVAGMALDTRGQAVLCAANKEDVHGCRLWRIDLATRGMSALVAGPVLASSPAVTGNGDIVALQADARTPLQPVRIGGAGRGRALAPEALPRDFPYAALVAPQAVTFSAPDGQDIHAQLFLPAGTAVSARPAIVHFHGGPTRQMFPSWHPAECYHLQYGMNQYLAGQGYVVLSVNYRGGSGYGLDFREPPGLGAGGASECQDAIGAAQFLGARPDVDPRRIGAYGVSYGGLMTALALARAPHLFAAGVDWAGVSNWQPAFAGAPAAVADTALRSSPLAAPGPWRPPVLFIHADDDRTVPFSQTVEIVKALRQQPGVEVECLVLPDEQHDFLRRASWARAFDATADFFDRKIGATAPALP